MNNQIVVKTKNGTKHVMDKDTYIRWLCLVEIVQLTEEKAQDLKIDLEKYDWIRPIEFKKYINERFKSMEVDFEAEVNSKKPLLKPMVKLAELNNSNETLWV